MVGLRGRVSHISHNLLNQLNWGGIWGAGGESYFIYNLLNHLNDSPMVLVGYKCQTMSHSDGPLRDESHSFLFYA